MGYDLHITRKEEWFEEEGDQITLDEWNNFVNSSPDMRLDGYAEAETPNGVLRVESEGLAVWTGYSGHDNDGNMAWFDYFEGNIKVKNPDDEIIKKMYQIAVALNAKVQGEECEVYGEDGQSNWQELKAEGEVMIVASSKKWWQFWK
ncbi:hypothetical protein [Gynuella sp.]|uniref:hypothetical protein n=1 Tax=Gynuella sp. TaxID=2969146 RepID=UPI003D0E7870